MHVDAAAFGGILGHDRHRFACMSVRRRAIREFLRRVIAACRIRWSVCLSVCMPPCSQTCRFFVMHFSRSQSSRLFRASLRPLHAVRAVRRFLVRHAAVPYD